MKPRALFCLLLLVPLAAVAQSAQPDDPRFNQIKARHERGEKLTEDERDYAETTIEHRIQLNTAVRNADYAKVHPPRESTGMVPLTDLGQSTYKGEAGGLYPNGSNTLPAEHLQAGLRLAKEIVPLDRDGHASPDGRVVLCSIGMSNTTQESRSFLKLLAAEPNINPKLTAVDGAQGAQTAAKISNPNFPYWRVVLSRLSDAGVTPKQVQVVWLKEANSTPQADFPIEAKKLQQDITAVLHNLHDKFPNLKIVYLSSRIYGGYAGTPLNPEPHAYESGFAVKWLIADQIAAKPELNFDPSRCPVRSPWLAWGPYLWADGLKPRSDGLVWKRDDLGPDGTHPSLIGRDKVAHLLLNFLKTDPTSQPWFLKH